MEIVTPESWKSPLNYHMTITKGELSLSAKMSGAIGSEVELKVHSIGVSNDAIAVGVSGLYSRNENQHITFSFKDNPYDSNNIEKWIEINPFSTFGYIREIDKKEGFGKYTQIEP